MDNEKKPAIRFRGFTDAWEQRKVGELASVSMNRRIFKEQTTENGDVPFFKIGTFGGIPDAYISRKLFEEYRAKYPYPKVGDILISASGSIGRTVEYSGKDEYFQDSNIVWLNHDERINNSFLKCFFAVVKWAGIEGSTIKRLYNDNILNTEISIPSIEEQSKIGAFFRNLDNLITLHQRKCEKLQNVKKSCLEKMFPKNGDSVPEIRFKGFTDAWEQRKLSDVISEFIVPMRDKPKEFGGTIPWTRIEDIEGKYLNGSLSGQYVTEETIKQMNLKVIPKHSLIVSSSATFGVVAIVTQDLITNQTFIGLVPNDRDELDYWYTFFQSNHARTYMKLQSAGSTIFYIAREHFENMPILLPTKQEMFQIGAYFRNLDNLITLHQRKLEKLQNIKKSCLEKMFV